MNCSTFLLETNEEIGEYSCAGNSLLKAKRVCITDSRISPVEMQRDRSGPG